MDFSTEQIAMLAQVERDMDSGKTPFVVENGQRYAFLQEVLDEFKIQSGQTVTAVILLALMEKTLA